MIKVFIIELVKINKNDRNGPRDSTLLQGERRKATISKEGDPRSEL